MVPEGYADPRSVTDLRPPRAGVAPSRLACGHQPLPRRSHATLGACWALPLTLTQLHKCANACRSDSPWRALRVDAACTTLTLTSGRGPDLGCIPVGSCTGGPRPSWLPATAAPSPRVEPDRDRIRAAGLLRGAHARTR